MIDNKLLLSAGIDLLKRSRLVVWDDGTCHFKERPEAPASDEFLEDSRFGRLVVWIMFSIGAEYLLKAVCTYHGVVVPEVQNLIGYPNEDVESWANQVASNPNKQLPNPVVVHDYGTLGDYYGGYIQELALQLSLDTSDEEVLVAGFHLLSTIRNRDVHTYQANERLKNYRLVPLVFIRCLNILLDSIASGGMLADVSS